PPVTCPRPPRHRAPLFADAAADRVRLGPDRRAPHLRDGSRRLQRAPAHVGRLPHAAALVAQGGRDRLHPAPGHARSLGGQPGRLGPSPPHRWARRQPGSDVGAERTSPRVPVEPARAMAGVRDDARRRGARADHPNARRAHKSFLVPAAAVIGCFSASERVINELKGGVMVTRGLTLTMSLVLSALVIAACAKQPATTSVSAPAPTTPPAVAAPGPEPTSPSGGPAAPAPAAPGGGSESRPAAARPAPAEFMAI